MIAIEPRPHLHNTRGFTLVELLVALVISAILAGVIFQFLQGQGEFARLQAAREEVQGNARLAVEMITADLRGAPPSAIQYADAGSIRIYSPRLWGLLCAPIDLAATGPPSFAVRFPSTPPSVTATSPEWGIALGRTSDPARPPLSWAFMTEIDVGTGTTACALPGGSAPPPGRPVGGSGVPWSYLPGAEDFVGPEIVLAGSPAFLFEEVSYDVAALEGGRNFIRRLRGYTLGSPATARMEPMAGPLSASDGLVFEYFDGAGNEILPATGATTLSPGQIAQISTIQVSVATESSQVFGADRTPQDAAASTIVRLRN